MKPFRFTLKAVQTVRANTERKALEAFALAQAEVERIAARKRTIDGEIDVLLAARVDVLKRPASADDIQRMQQGVRALRFQQQQCAAEMQNAKTIVDLKSRALLDARQKREVVDKIHDKQRAKHHAHMAQIEQKTLDDFAVMQAAGRAALKWR
jgi:flagellar export protein FliJ